MAEVLTWLFETVYERVMGFRNYIWQAIMTIPADTKVRIDLYVPKVEIWIEYGYKFEVDALDVFEFTHYHDGREMYRDLLIGESELDLPYTKPDLAENIAVIYLKNTDTVSAHKIKCLARYRIIPRKMYEELKEKAYVRK